VKKKGNMGEEEKVGGREGMLCQWEGIMVGFD
jgi:hypothetical protein